MPTELVADLLEPYLGAATGVAAVSLAIALGALVYRYYRTGEVGFADLPFRAKMRLVHAIRSEYFKKGTPSTRAPLDDDLDAVVDLLAENGYIPEWPLSYHYRGENANLVRYYYDESREFPHRQVHVRLFDREDGEPGTDLYAHEEPYGLNHPREHIDSNNMTDVTEQVAEAYRVTRDGDEPILDPRLWVPRSES